MLLILLYWSYLFFVVTNLGLSFQYFLLHRKDKKKADLRLDNSFWVGLLILTGILSYYSLILPLDKICFVFISLVSILCLLKTHTYWLHLIKSIKLKNNKVRFFILLSSIFVYLILNQASANTIWYDTNLYHLNSVKWLADYGSVPGLANLHLRLGFNSNMFLFAALTDVSIFTSSSSHVVLSLLLLVATLSWIHALVFEKEDLIAWYFVFLTLPFLLGKIFSIEVSSLSPDLAMDLAVLFFAREILSREKNFLLIISAGLLALTFKLSAVVIVVMAFVYYFKNIASVKKQIYPTILLGLFVSIGYLLRNLVISGWPFFPIPLKIFNFDWSVPRSLVMFISDRVKTWARQPGSLDNEVLKLSFSEWFKSWFGVNIKTLEVKSIIFSALLLTVTLILTKKLSFKKFLNFEYWFIEITTILSVTYIFLVAPSVRFLDVFSWIFLAVTLLPYLLLLNKSKFKYFVFIILTGVTLLLTKNLYYSKKPLSLFKIPKDNALPTKAVELNQEGKRITVRVPIKSDQCGNSYLPCTPTLYDIKLRDANDLSKGFKM